MVNQRAAFVVYEWTKGETVLGYGITDDPERRTREHQREEPHSSVRAIANEPTEIMARERGINKLREYEKDHGDLPPKNRPR